MEVISNMIFGFLDELSAVSQVTYLGSYFLKNKLICSYEYCVVNGSV